jgi:FkbM family methyltransferase
MSYSQGQEEKVILNYFYGRIGTLLSIGENDGITLSNALALIERGWNAVLVEPDPEAFTPLVELHQWNKNVISINAAISDKDGSIDFFSSGPIGAYPKSTGLVSTLVAAERNAWISQSSFVKTKVNSYTVAGLMQSLSTLKHPIEKFNFITIDAEGMDYTILKQMDLTAMGCELLCVEWNGKDQELFEGYARQFGLSIKFRNAENLIYGK